MERETFKMTIDGDWYDDLVGELIEANDFDKAIDLVRAITDCIQGISDAEREQLEFDIMNGTRHFYTCEDGMIGISEAS